MCCCNIDRKSAKPPGSSGCTPEAKVQKTKDDGGTEIGRHVTVEVALPSPRHGAAYDAILKEGAVMHCPKEWSAKVERKRVERTRCAGFAIFGSTCLLPRTPQSYPDAP